MDNNIFDAFNSAAKQASPSSESRKPKSGLDILQFGNKGKKITDLYFRILPGNGILNNDMQNLSDFAKPFRTIFLKASDPSSDKKASYYNPVLSSEPNENSKIEQAISRWEQNGALESMVAQNSSYGAPSIRTRAYLNVIPVLSANNNFSYKVNQETGQPVVQVMDVPSTVVRDILEKLGNKLNAPAGSQYSFVDLQNGALAHISLKDNKYQFDVYPQVVMPALTADWVRNNAEDLNYLAEPTESYKGGFEEHFIKLVDNSVNSTSAVDPSQITQPSQSFFSGVPSGNDANTPDPFGVNQQRTVTDMPQAPTPNIAYGSQNQQPTSPSFNGVQRPLSSQPSDSFQDGSFPNTSTSGVLNSNMPQNTTQNQATVPNPTPTAPKPDVSDGSDLIDMDELARIANSNS
ncbi:hypothetical protein RND61_15310 [Streptomyces sp. TRM76323]|uniref:Uncharacterized protein n=1 Tax=Streptomyces tamarix TaxID=3078565 RepID=A0ABU3QKY4_9ACTN|nr:hypothetical protein [Streptomyces tamarix]MDT9683416.1 hypothetical protein [Streptomyces tamarix]